MDLQRGIRRAKLSRGSITLPRGFSAWYYERPAESRATAPPLVVLPGATLDMDFMGARMSGLFQRLPNRRIIIVELPHHGANVSPNYDFSKPAESMADMAHYVEHVLQALDVKETIDLIGYSMGGGIAAHYVQDYPQRLNRLVLLAPYFYELATDAFIKALDSGDWSSIHGWETLAQMKQFFQHWLGYAPADLPPEFIMRALHALRADQYPAGYWHACLTSLHEKSHESRTLFAGSTVQLRALKRPTLVITASLDAMCDCVKLERLKEAFGPDYCTVETVECGHVFGARGTTVFQAARAPLLRFLK